MKRAMALLLLISLSGCAASVAPPASAPAAAPATGDVRSGSSWRVISYFDGQQAMASPIIGAEISAVLGEDGQITGSAGCNSYAAAYRIEGGAIAIGAIAATRRHCAEPLGVMEQEARYFEALQSATIVRSDGEIMQLRTARDSLAVHLARGIPGDRSR